MRSPEDVPAAGEMTGYRLRFPRGMQPEGVVSFLSGLTGMLPRWWKRWLGVPFVVVEIHATHRGIEHFLLVPRQWAPAIENLLQASLPSVRYEFIDVPAPSASAGAEYQLSSSQRPLRIDARSMATKLLTNLQPLHKGEAVYVQWIVAPAAPTPPPRVRSKAEQDRWLPPVNTVTSAEALSSLKAKQSSTLLIASGRVGVRAQTDERGRLLLRHVELAWSESSAPGVHLRRRPVRREAAARRIERRSVPYSASTYNAGELSALIGWPIEALAIPGLDLGSSRLLPASPAVPRSGTVVARSNFPGGDRPLAIETDGRLRNTWILGPTGAGKSTLISNMAALDMAAGRAVVVVDPKGGDLVTDVLAQVPPSRRDDVIVFDPSDDERPVGLNPLQCTPATAEATAEHLLGLFKSLYRASWGPRTDDVMRAVLLTLTTTGGGTLCEVPLLLTDASYRQRVIGRLDDPLGLEAFWGWYESISDSEKLAVIGPTLNKVRAFTMRPRVRSVIGQARPALSLRRAIAERKIVVVSLASGLLGEEAASLLGALVVNEVWNAVKARAEVSREKRTPVAVYLDEFQRVLHLPTPMSSVLAECRGYGMALTVAHQELGQLSTEVHSALANNARSRIVFQLSASDARVMAREMAGLLDPSDLQGLGAYEIVTQIYAKGSTQPPATGQTLPPGDELSDPAQLREASRQRYGVDRAEVEAAIRERQQPSAPTGPVGRRRRVAEPEAEPEGGPL